MKKYVLILCGLCCNLLFAQKALPYYEINNKLAEENANYKSAKKLTYFDVNGLEITQKEFKKHLSKHRFFQIPGDSLHHRRLVQRENHGQLNDHPKFIRLLETELDIKLDATKPIVVIYYPGRDRCNASGSATKKTMNKWHSELQAGVLGKSNDILYIYKNSEGMKRKYDLSKWNKDPQGIMERLFFPYHFPCGSFVVVSKTGRYISYYGEFGKPAVWRVVDFLRK